MDTTEKQRTEKATRPASRWRNKWLALRTFTAIETGKVRHRGAEHWGMFVWPSRDTAETYGQKCESANTHLKYLGAFPVEGE